MGKVSIRGLLYLIAAAPLAAFLWLSIQSVIDSYAQYQRLNEQMVVQQLATAGGKIAQAMPAESFATVNERVARRQISDLAMAELRTTYEAWKARGHADETIDRSFAFVQDKQALFPGYRAKVDSGQPTSGEERTILQPTAAAGLELVRRSAGTITDIDLGRYIDGYHAMMQVNDAGLIEINLGRKYLSGAVLSPAELQFLFLAKGLRDRYLPVMREFLPSELITPFNDFFNGPEGTFMSSVRQKMYNEPPQGNDQASLDRWVKGSGAQAGLMAQLIAKTGEQLSEKAATQLNGLKFEFIKSAVIAVGVTMLVLVLCFVVVRNISRMIRSIQQRMGLLADGDTITAIPFINRTDEIGDMAQSVETFRQGAIRNTQLEAEAATNRNRAEAERIEMQARAEAEAEDRLEKATQTFAINLRRLAQGDMLCEIDTPMTAQFEALRGDFNTSVRQLREALLSVGRSVSTVTDGSKEISDASDNLARRTEQQAASLEETAAALEEITANVVATSKRTTEARDVVRDARSRAERSGAVVRNAVSAMQRIEESSRQINQIIAVIDEIAFQTNLLALNAGVEAARAGEAGKGFAVVAQEVRELAQRSANAAKEIKGLITNSATAVSEGVKLVSDTGDGLSSIEQLVQTINAHMDAIATAAQEQSSGLAEVNTAVNHMDQATQQNAAMVEEMSAAGAGLAQESYKLSELLAQFQFDGFSQRSRAVTGSASMHVARVA
jgi:methyl-accepting chemotaxis protein